MMGLSFTIAAGPRQRTHSQVRVREIHDHILLSQIRDSPKPGEPGPRIYIPSEQGGPVITPGTGLPFRRLLLLAGLQRRYSTPVPHGTKRIEITISNSSIILCLSVAVETCINFVATFWFSRVYNFQFSCPW
jgi:hypothetical protein